MFTRERALQIPAHLFYQDWHILRQRLVRVGHKEHLRHASAKVVEFVHFDKVKAVRVTSRLAISATNDRYRKVQHRIRQSIGPSQRVEAATSGLEHFEVGDLSVVLVANDSSLVLGNCTRLILT